MKIRITDAQALHDAMQSRDTPDGSTLLLAPGVDFGDFFLRRNGTRPGRPGLTITQDDPLRPAFFRRAGFWNTKNLTLDRMLFRWRPGADEMRDSAKAGYVLDVRNLSGFSMRRSAIIGEDLPALGKPRGRGVIVPLGGVIEDCNISGVTVAMSLRGYANISRCALFDNWLTPIIGDGHEAKIHDTYIGRFRGPVGDQKDGRKSPHKNAVHFFPKPHWEATEGIEVHRVIIDQGADDRYFAPVGLHFDGNGTGLPFLDLSVRNVLILNANGTGMRLEGVRSGEVVGNTMIYSGRNPKRRPDSSAPGILILGGAPELRIAENVAARIRDRSGLTNVGENTLISWDQYPEFLATKLPRDVENLRVITGGCDIDSLVDVPDPARNPLLVGQASAPLSMADKVEIMWAERGGA